MNSQRRTPTPTPTPPLLRGGRKVDTVAAKVKSVEISNTPVKQAREKKDMNGDGSSGRISPLTPINTEAPRRTPSPLTQRNALKSSSRSRIPSRHETAPRSPARVPSPQLTARPSRPSSPRTAHPSRPSSPMTARKSPVRSERLTTTKREATVEAAIARARSIHLIRHQKVSPLLEEEHHRYRVVYNRLLQWRFANARGEASMASTHRIAQKKLLRVWVKMSAIRNSTVEKRTQMQKLKQDLKFYEILKSEMKLLDEWSKIEQKNVVGVDRVVRKLSAASVCLPVDDDAKADTESVHDAMWKAMEVVESIQAMVMDMHSQAEKIWSPHGM